MALASASISKIETKLKKSPKRHLAKLKPTIHEVKEGTELVVVASELFAIIGGLFAM